MNVATCRHKKYSVWWEGVTYDKVCGEGWTQFTNEQRRAFVEMHVAYNAANREG